MEKLRDLNNSHQSDAGLNSLCDAMQELTAAAAAPSAAAAAINTSCINQQQRSDDAMLWNAEVLDIEIQCTKCQRTVLSSSNQPCLCEDRNIYDIEQLDNNPKIFVGNVSFKASWHELADFFSRYGKVVHTYIVKDHRTHKPRGIAFVTFQSSEGALKALTAPADELYFQHRHLRVHHAEQKRRDITNKVKLPEINHFDAPAPAAVSAAADPGVSDQPDATGLQITDLNADDLLIIFSYLTPRERILIERVCRLWRSLSLQSWSSFNELSLQGLNPRFGGFTDRQFKQILLRTNNLRKLDVTGSSMLSDHALTLIGDHCSNLTHLNISGLHATNTSIKVLSEKCSKLESIIMRRCYDVSEKGLWWLFKNCQDLRSLNLEDNMRITGQCLHMAGPCLEQIVLDSCGKLQTVAIQKLAEKCPNLKHLSINDCMKLMDEAFDYIEQMQNLQVLKIGGFFHEITTTGLRKVGSLKNLDSLYLTNNKSVDDAVLRSVAFKRNNLCVLDIMGCHQNITDVGLGYLSHCPNLQYLNVSYVQKFSDGNLSAIAVNGNLKRLIIRACPEITLESIAELAKCCTKLEELDISGNSQLNNNTIELLSTESLKQGRPHLSVIVGGTEIDIENTAFHSNITVCPVNLSRSYLRPDRDLMLILGDDDDFIDENGPLPPAIVQQFGIPAGFEDEIEEFDDFCMDDYHDDEFLNFPEIEEFDDFCMDDYHDDEFLFNDDPLEAERFEFMS
ncbi:putative RNA-binding protein EEED8.10 isoform X2 [Tubulanus polymorphus]|uniref:putative RNA-binding protein EEED8.10 isoform X2 n=1 Tax=Tubulanus polymorphus TaxID=672921 RepID=UPI003DA563B7